MDFFIKAAGLSTALSISTTQIAYSVLALMLIYLSYKKNITGISANRYWIYFILLIIMVVITDSTGINPKKSFEDLKKIVLPLLFFAGYYLYTEKRLKDFIVYTLIGGVISVIYGFYRFFISEKGVINTASGAYKSPVSFGNVMALICIAGIFYLMYGKYRSVKERNLVIFSLTVSLIGLFATTTRGAILAFICSVTMLLVFKYSKESLRALMIRLAIFGGIFACLLAISMVLVPFMRYTIYEMFFKWDDPTTSAGWRLELWKKSWEVFKEHPLVGIGMGNINSVFNDYFSVKYQSIAHCHSIYFQTMVDYGLFGVVVILILYLKLAKDFFIKYSRGCEYGAIGLASVVLIAVAGLTESCLFDSELCMLFWCFSGAFMRQCDEKH